MKPHKERLMLKTRQSSEKLVKLIFLIDRYFFPQPSLKILSPDESRFDTFNSVGGEVGKV